MPSLKPAPDPLHGSAVGRPPATPGWLERQLELGTLRLDAAAARFERGPLAMARSIIIALGVLLLMAWATREAGLRGDGAWPGALLAGWLLCLISFSLYAWRFCHSLRVFELALRTRQSLRINLLAMFYQCFLPLAVGADLTRYVKLRGLAPDRRPLFMAGGIVLDHLVGLVSLGLLALPVGGLALVRHGLVEGADVVVAVPMLIALGALLLRRHAVIAPGATLQYRLRSHWRSLVAAIALSMAMHCVTAAAIYAGSRGWPLTIAYSDILLVLTLSFMLQSVPFNLLGLGAAEIGSAALYVALGLSPAAAVLLVSMLYAYRLLLAALGGLWDLLPD